MLLKNNEKITNRIFDADNQFNKFETNLIYKEVNMKPYLRTLA